MDLPLGRGDLLDPVAVQHLERAQVLVRGCAQRRVLDLVRLEPDRRRHAAPLGAQGVEERAVDPRDRGSRLDRAVGDVVDVERGGELDRRGLGGRRRLLLVGRGEIPHRVLHPVGELPNGVGDTLVRMRTRAQAGEDRRESRRDGKGKCPDEHVVGHRRSSSHCSGASSGRL